MSGLSHYFHEAITPAWVTKARPATMEKLDGNALIKSLQQGESQVLDKVYGLYRDEFISWSSRQFKGMNREDFVDAWQESIIAFYDQVMSYKLVILTCELKTYLFIIGRRYNIRQLGKLKRIEHVDPVEGKFSQASEMIRFEWDDPDMEKKELVAAAFKTIGEQCRTILLMRFGEGLSVPAIMEKSGYPNLNTVSATLSRCLRKLKELIQEKIQHRTA